jgi:hypothetical protein
VDYVNLTPDERWAFDGILSVRIVPAKMEA